jgi:hypothetical protein
MHAENHSGVRGGRKECGCQCGGDDEAHGPNQASAL